MSSMKGPIVRGVEKSRIVDLFRHKKHVNDDATNDLASYVVVDSKDRALLFFSLRCGELFENLDYENLELTKEFWELYQRVNRPDWVRNEAEVAKLDELIAKFRKSGLTPDDIVHLGKKKSDLIEDLKNEPESEISRVSEVFPGVELKFFGITSKSKQVWDETGLPGKVGVALFWRFVIQKLEEMQNLVGCKYLYLFAADDHADGDLVSYYRTRLHLDAHHGLTSNKPHFDFSSWFLYQEIAELARQRKIYFDNFNSGMI